MKYAQVAAELKAKGELEKVITMLKAMGDVDYVFYYEDYEEDWEQEDTPDWRHDLEYKFGRDDTSDNLRAILATNYPGFNDTQCQLVSKTDAYLAPAGHEYHYHRWETEYDVNKIVEGSPFEARKIRVNFVVLYPLCPELFDQEMLPAGNADVDRKYWLVPEGLGLNYEVGLELLAACQAA